MRYAMLLRRLAALALRHPSLLIPLLGAAWRFRARGWFIRPPFLPLPPAEYVAWRMETAYGSADAVPPAHELGRFLAWTRRGGAQ